ncbi:MAG: hypothetical protein JOZ96_25450 [Acidobacteria bacterium]|nr:hypothetical protein [Acidobacteriota bacterium]
MKRTFPLLSAVCLLFLFVASAAAQTAGPPKVFLFEREEIRPGKFEEHQRESNNFARTLAYAKKAGQPSYVRLGMSPLAGNYNEVMYAYPFDSLEQWAQAERDMERWIRTPGPVKAFYEGLMGPPRAGEDLHASERSMVAVYSPELSYNPRTSLARVRYVAISTFRIKVGHYGDWLRLTAMYTDAVKKMKGEHHWATYESVGGAPDGTFVIISALESLAEMDSDLTNSAEFPKAMGDKLGDFEKLSAATIESITTTIYQIDPKMTNPPESFVAADPQFWSQEMPAAAPVTRTASARTKKK